MNTLRYLPTKTTTKRLCCKQRVCTCALPMTETFIGLDKLVGSDVEKERARRKRKRL